MEQSVLNRREWLKRGALAFTAVALTPRETWASLVVKAQNEKRSFLYETHTYFNEFVPPELPNFNMVKARLIWNENPYGPSKKAIASFQKKALDGNHYSWSLLDDLIAKIAKNEGVKPSQIMMGPGSSDLLEKTAMILFSRNQGNIISADPSYMSLITVAKAAGGEWKAIKLTKDYQHDLDGMEKAIDENTKLVYITNPNNPTATITDTENLKSFCERVATKVPVFIDEAYIELSKGGLKNSMAPLVAEGKNILVSRTFSKIYGMAGLRVGYMMGSEKMIQDIKDITRGGMGISGPSIAAASTSLDDYEFTAFCKEKLIEARSYTVNYLKEHDIVCMPSQTNFLIFPIDMDGNTFLEKIYAKKVVVRAFKFWEQNWCRVSIGTMDEMKVFTTAISEILV